MMRVEGVGRDAELRKGGVREAVCDRLGEPAAEVIGKTQNHPPVCREDGRTRAVVWRTGEGWGRSKKEKTQIQEFCGQDHWGRAIFYWVSPPPTSIYYQQHSWWARPQALGRLVGISGAARQALDGSRCRRAASKGLLPPRGKKDPGLRGDRGAARERESTSAHTGTVGEGWGVMIKGEEDRIRRHDLEGGRGGATVHVGMIKVEIIHKGLEIVT